MLTMSQKRASSGRNARRWARLERPLLPLDNPVRRYLGNQALGFGTRRVLSRLGMGRLTVRPAT